MRLVYFIRYECGISRKKAIAMCFMVNVGVRAPHSTISESVIALYALCKLALVENLHLRKFSTTANLRR